MPGDARLPADLLQLDAGALYVCAQLNLATQVGRHAYSNLKFYGDEVQWSIGFIVGPGGSMLDPEIGTTRISRVDALEASPVLWGAAPLARSLAIKSAKAPGPDVTTWGSGELFEPLEALATTPTWTTLSRIEVRKSERVCPRRFSTPPAAFEAPL